MKNKKLIKQVKDAYDINGLYYYYAYVYVEPFSTLTCVEVHPIRCDNLHIFRKMPKHYIYMYTKKKITSNMLIPYME